jgi:L-aspartate oxidase
VYLDLSHLEQDPHALFPGISRICRTFGIDIAREPIPVRPGAHYMIGGVQVDSDGRTSVPHLWAVGECASSGLHGANRMGSNSLLEGLVMGAAVGEATAQAPGRSELVAVRHSRAAGSRDVRLSLEDMTYSLKSLMWRQMGMVRTGAAIADALDKIHFWGRAVQRLAPEEPKAWELLNMLLVARLAAHAALAREESRGVHFRLDHPREVASWCRHSVLSAERNREGMQVRLEFEPVAALVER